MSTEKKCPSNGVNVTKTSSYFKSHKSSSNSFNCNLRYLASGPTGIRRVLKQKTFNNLRPPKNKTPMLSTSNLAKNNIFQLFFPHPFLTCLLFWTEQSIKITKLILCVCCWYCKAFYHNQQWSDESMVLCFIKTFHTWQLKRIHFMPLQMECGENGL